MSNQDNTLHAENVLNCAFLLSKKLQERNLIPLLLIFPLKIEWIITKKNKQWNST